MLVSIHILYPYIGYKSYGYSPFSGVQLLRPMALMLWEGLVTTTETCCGVAEHFYLANPDSPSVNEYVL